MLIELSTCVIVSMICGGIGLTFLYIHYIFSNLLCILRIANFDILLYYLLIFLFLTFFFPYFGKDAIPCNCIK